MTFKIFLAAALTATSALAGGAGWSPNFAASQKLASTEGKDLLVEFMGSDWCSWCIKLNKEVFEREEFRNGVKDFFVLVELDYPNDQTKLPAEILKQNEELKKQYPVKGFPTVLLCDPAGKPYAITGYRPDGPVKYVEQLHAMRARKPARDAAFAKAAEAQGVEKARLLVEALKALELDDELVRICYKDQTDQIKAADPADGTGFAKKMETSRQLAEFNIQLGEFMTKGDQAGAAAFMDRTLAVKDLPVTLFQHIHGHKAGFLMYAKKPAEALKVLETGIAAGPDTDIGKELKGFLVLVNKELQTPASVPGQAAPSATPGQLPAADPKDSPAKPETPPASVPAPAPAPGSP
ncbi:MAG: thioredoxin fold domain-containing protein [Verrucomicrobiota bacterium]